MISRMKLLLSLPGNLYEMMVRHLPGPSGDALRLKYWKKRLKFMGTGVRIGTGVRVVNPSYVSLDDHCWVDHDVLIMAGPPGRDRICREKENRDFKLEKGEVYIGKNTHVAPGVILSGFGGIYIGRNSGIASYSMIYSFSHHYRNLTDPEDSRQYSFTPMARDDRQAMILGPIYIGDYCAVGLNCVLLPGTSLLKGTWAASGSVLTGSYAEQSLILNRVETLTRSLSHLTIKESDDDSP